MNTPLHWLLDRVANDPNVSPTFAATVYPPRVLHREIENGGEYEVCGKNRDNVEAEAERLRVKLHGNKSLLTCRPNGVWVQWVTYAEAK